NRSTDGWHFTPPLTFTTGLGTASSSSWTFPAFGLPNIPSSASTSGIGPAEQSRKRTPDFDGILGSRGRRQSRRRRHKRCYKRRSMRVPLIKPDLPDISAVQQEFAEILNNGRITNFGRYVAEFEARTGEYLGVPTVTVSSGTMGLLFTLCALGLRPRDKVILPSFTFMATAQAVCFAGGIPVFAEVDEDLNI